MKYKIIILTILLLIPTFAGGKDDDSAAPEQRTINQEILRDNLKLSRVLGSIPKEIKLDPEILQRDIRRLQSQIIDLKVDRDAWRDQAHMCETVEDSNRIQADNLETQYLLVAYFERYMREHEVPFPDAITTYKSDIVAELKKLGYFIGEE